jgi:hypothetical protein
LLKQHLALGPGDIRDCALEIVQYLKGRP